MDLKELLGDDFKDDMTAEDITGIMEKRLLATGKYENKEKVDAERKKAKQEKADLEAKFKSKMTDDELSQKEMDDLKAEIEALKAEKAESNKKYSKTLTESNMSEAKTLLEIKDSDKEFLEFMQNISVENSEIAGKTSRYVMKMIKDAYEKGKAQGTKESLGKMGESIIGEDGKVVDKDAAFVKSLISSAPQTIQTKNSNFK